MSDSLAEKVAAYAVHKKGCPARRWNSLDRTFGVCNCGLKKLMLELRAMVDKEIEA